MALQQGFKDGAKSLQLALKAARDRASGKVDTKESVSAVNYTHSTTVQFSSVQFSSVQFSSVAQSVLRIFSVTES